MRHVSFFLGLLGDCCVRGSASASAQLPPSAHVGPVMLKLEIWQRPKFITRVTDACRLVTRVHLLNRPLLPPSWQVAGHGRFNAISPETGRLAARRSVCARYRGPLFVSLCQLAPLDVKWANIIESEPFSSALRLDACYPDTRGCRDAVCALLFTSAAVDFDFHCFSFSSAFLCLSSAVPAGGMKVAISRRPPTETFFFNLSGTETRVGQSSPQVLVLIH
jgi:hypothetical protein